MSTVRTLFLLGAAMASTALTAREASACRCMQDTRPLATRVAADKAKASGIFLGTVRWSAAGVHLLRVGNIFKGSVDKYVRIADKSTAECGYPFTVGTSYVVFATGAGGAYQNPGTCFGLLTTPAQGASALLALLGPGQVPPGDRIPDELDEPCRPGMSRPPQGGVCQRAVRPLPSLSLTCRAAGDSMASLKLVASPLGIGLTEATMGDKTFEFRAASSAALFGALAGGQPVTLVGTATDTVAFGGAQSPAALLFLGAAAANVRSGHYARGGIVFGITCQPTTVAATTSIKRVVAPPR